MIPTHNCARYLREALAGVLAQDPGAERMQIEVVDDASTADDPSAVVAELGAGRVGFFRQSTNVGHVRNFNTCLQRSRGHLVHLLHGDDAVLPGFYERMQRLFESCPEIGAAFCRYVAITESGRRWGTSELLQPNDGVLPNWLERIASGQLLQPPSMVVRRSVYEHLGGFDARIRAYGEDWEMWVRIAAHFPVAYLTEPLAVYRVRDTSLSGRALRAGENGRDLRRVIAINRELLPPAIAVRVSLRARRNFADASLKRGHRFLGVGDRGAALAQLREALRSYPSPVVLTRAMGFLLRWLWRAVVRR